MSSIVVDEASSTDAPITNEQEQNVTEEATTEEVTQEAQAEETPQPEFEVPEKFAGKSTEELVEMYQNVEKMMGKQASEVGEQRKLIQSLMESQNRAAEATPNVEEPTNLDDDFYTDPTQAVNKAIENHPELVEARKERIIQQQQHQVGVLEKAYPDWQERVATKEFQDWVGSSEIRTEMFRKADSDYRPDYAIELFDMFDKVNMIDKTKEVQKAESQKRDKALKATTTETRSTSESIGGKKVYRRADLINLQVTDPSRYASLADEIQSAYAEGRVK
jgi:hypothetical protein